MHRCGPVFLFTLTITFVFVLALTGCLGKSSSNSGNEGVKLISLSPKPSVSLDVGATQVFTATGYDANGRGILGLDIQYIVVSGNPNAAAPLSIASNGKACAGTWDSSVAICNPGTPGIALVTAVSNGVSSPVTTVYVHQHIDSIQIVRLPPVSPQQLYDCFPQGQTWLFQGVAYNNIYGDITDSVGPMIWSSSNSDVVTTAPYTSPLQPNVLNQIQTTAQTPGITNLFASVAGTTSSPYAYTTCLVKAIYLQIGGQGTEGNSITVNSGSNVVVTATAIDTLYGIADFAPLSAPPLTWSTTNPEVAAFSTTTNNSGTNTAAVRYNLGGATLTASCTPPSCNIGVLPSLPIYASDGTLPNGTKGYGTISVDAVLGTTAKPPTYTAWAATTGCGDATGCTSALFSVTPGTNPIGSTILSLPRTPNSLMFNHVSASRLYIGSDQGLMYMDVSGSPTVVSVSDSSTPCNVALCGKLLTISNNGRLVVVSDTVSTPSQVYIYNGGGAPVDLILSNPGETATAAAFSPDQLKLFILTQIPAPPPALAGTYIGGNMYVYSTVDGLTLISPLSTGNFTFPAPANVVVPSMDGSFAYVAVQPVPTVYDVPPITPLIPGFVSGFANCDTPTSEVLSDVLIANFSDPSAPTINANPLALYPLPTLQPDINGNPTEVVLALDTPVQQEPDKQNPQAPTPPPPPPTTVDMFGVNVEQFPLLYNQFACTPPSVTVDTNFPQTSIDLGQGNFTPLYSQLIGDGTGLLIVAQNIPAVLLFNVSSGQTSSIPLARSGFGSSYPLWASASTDGSQVFVAACDQYDPNVKPPNPPVCAVGSIHIVNTVNIAGQGYGDVQQVQYSNSNDNDNRNMCNNEGNPAPQCLPNLVAIKPQ